MTSVAPAKPPPRVSIIILNYFHPELITRTCSSLAMTTDVPYEVVVVDNGSDEATRQVLRDLQARGWIDKLVLNDTNRYFRGCNDGVAASDPDAEFLLLLNSDVEILTPVWLQRMVQWMEGVPPTLEPLTGPDRPEPWPWSPLDRPRDAVSFDWCWDPAVLPGGARPDGWCLCLRRWIWDQTGIIEDFPWSYGWEELLTRRLRSRGGVIGVTCMFHRHIKHYGHGSHTEGLVPGELAICKGQPDMPAWFSGLDIETLDFQRGPQQDASYLGW